MPVGNKQSGEYTIVNAMDRVVQGATLSCCHCQTTWVVQKGSGRLRGFCQNCMGFVCGPGCAECVPLERRIENIEAGRPENTPAPVKILIPAGIETITGG